MTGARGDVPVDLKDFVGRIRAVTDKNLAVGFGISTPAHVAQVTALADGVVVGSAILNAIDSAGPDATTAQRAAKVQAFIAELKGGAKKDAAAAGAAAHSNVRLKKSYISLTKLPCLSAALSHLFRRILSCNRSYSRAQRLLDPSASFS